MKSKSGEKKRTTRQRIQKNIWQYCRLHVRWEFKNLRCKTYQISVLNQLREASGNNKFHIFVRFLTISKSTVIHLRYFQWKLDGSGKQRRNFKNYVLIFVTQLTAFHRTQYTANELLSKIHSYSEQLHTLYSSLKNRPTIYCP